MTRKPEPGSSLFTAASYSWLLLLFALVPLTCWSQSEEDEDTQGTSQHVEESEEAYRRRMETEEAGDRADVILDRSSGPLKAPEGIEALPYDSRKHLRDELRNVIIEQGEWQPEDVNATYAYSPSAAAQKDPKLRQEEEKAWGELIQEYHKREAAALEAGGGGGGGSVAGQGQGSGQSGGQSGGQSSGTTGGSESSKSGGSGSPNADTRPESAATSSTAAGAGVSQSALEFLKGQSGGQSGGQAGGQPGGQAGSQSGSQSGGKAGAEAASQSAANPSSGAEKSPAEKQQPEVAKAEENQSKSSSKEKEQSDSPPPPAGSVAIAELAALDESQKRKAAQEQQSATQKSQEQQAEAQKSAAPETEQEKAQAAASDGAEDSKTQSITVRNEVDEPPPPPGTLAIPELEKLQGLASDTPEAAKKPQNKP